MAWRAVSLQTSESISQKVFVSSTYADLLAEPESAVQSSLRADHISAGMERFVAGDALSADRIEPLPELRFETAHGSETEVDLRLEGQMPGALDP